MQRSRKRFSAESKEVEIDLVRYKYDDEITGLRDTYSDTYSSEKFSAAKHSSA